MRKLPFILILLTLGACSEEQQPKEITYTVDELKADDVLRAEISEKCRNNPGELGPTPNCINAADADWKVRMQRMKDEHKPKK